MNGTVFFNDANVWVTQESFVNGSNTFPVASILSANIAPNHQLQLLDGLLLLAGIGLCFASVYAGVIGLAVAWAYRIRQRSYHLLVLNVNGVDTQVLKSRDLAFLQKVLGALGKAMIVRDVQTTLPAGFLEG